jgi:hypothetical protein
MGDDERQRQERADLEGKVRQSDTVPENPAGCIHPDKRSVCYNCKRQYTCKEAQDPEVEWTETCGLQEKITG